MSELDFDRALLKEAANGDLSAFEEIILKYEKLIYNIAYRMFSNPEDAKDISQEVLLKIYKNIKKAPEIKSFKSWICTITTNTCIDEIRKKKPVESLDSFFGEGEGYEMASSEPSAEVSAIKNELGSELQKAIGKLPVEYRTLIILRDINGFSYNELAAITKCNLGTIKSRLSRARDSLRNIVVKNNLREEG